MNREPDQFDPFGSDVLECPFGYYEALREQAPVYKVPGKDFYILTRYDHVKTALQKPGMFSSDTRYLSTLPPQVDALFLPEPALVVADPPRHKSGRDIVQKLFTPARVQKMGIYIQQLIDEYMAAFLDKGKVEFLSEFAVMLPMTVIADQLGFARADMPKFKAWTNALLVGHDAAVTQERLDAAVPLLMEMNEYFIDMLEERRRGPDDDIISVIAAAADVGGAGEERRPGADGKVYLSQGEYLTICQQLLAGGNETTTSLLAASMVMLVEQPALVTAVRDDPERRKTFVEEALRLEAPNQGMWRVAMQDIELEGVTIPKGAMVNVRFGAANRDFRRFPEPEAVDLCRANAATHTSFGGGIHFCPGSPLARKEADMALASLLSRMANIRFDPDFPPPTHWPSFLVRTIPELHLVFDKI